MVGSKIIALLEADGYRVTGKVGSSVRMEKGRYKALVSVGPILMAHDNDWKVVLPQDFETRTMDSIENSLRRHGPEYKRQPSYLLRNPV